MKHLIFVAVTILSTHVAMAMNLSEVKQKACNQIVGTVPFLTGNECLSEVFQVASARASNRWSVYASLSETMERSAYTCKLEIQGSAMRLVYCSQSLSDRE